MRNKLFVSGLMTAMEIAEDYFWKYLAKHSEDFEGLENYLATQFNN